MVPCRFCASLPRIEEEDFLDIIQFSYQALHRYGDACFFDSAIRSSSQKERYGTIETVYIDFFVRPMIKRPPTADVTIFHLFKDILNVKLTTIGQNDLVITPMLPIGYHDVLAQICIRYIVQDCMVNAIC